MQSKKGFRFEKLLFTLIIAIVAGVAVYLVSANMVYALAVLGITMIGAPFMGDWGRKNLKLGKDSYQIVPIGIAIAVLLGVAGTPNVVSDIFSGTITGITGFVGTPSGTAAYTGQPQYTYNQPIAPPQTGNIITTSATMNIIATNLLNKTEDKLNPSGYYMYGGSYQTLSFSSGKATISSLDPYAVIDKISAGTDGTFYWEQKPSVSVGGQLSPTVAVQLVRVFTASDLRVYSQGGGGTTAYSDLTNGTANYTVGSAGSMKFWVRFEVTSLYTGIRHPVFGHSVNTTAVNDVTMAGLSTVTCPSGLVTDSSERTLFRCFDSGYDWFVDSGSKTGLAGTIVYGFKDFPSEVSYKTGINPGVQGGCAGGTEGHSDRIYVFDQDQYFTSPVGQLFFLDPPTQGTNLGSTNNANIYVCPA